MVLTHPTVICHKGDKDLGKSCLITEVLIVFPLAPGHYIGACCRGVVAGKVILTCPLLDLTADKAVYMLMGIEVIKSLLEFEYTVGVVAEHKHKGGVPHKDTAVEGGIDEV